MSSPTISAVRDILTKPLICPMDAVVGDAVYLSGADTVALASAASLATANVFGLVYLKVTPTSCIVMTLGSFDLLTGLTPQLPYYLSDTPGQLSTVAGTNSVVVGVALDAT